MEWHNETSFSDYPFEPNNSIPKDAFLDACFSLNDPVYLTNIKYLGNNKYLIVINNHLEFYYSGNLNYAYNDFGKLVIGNFSYFKSSHTFNLKFLDSVSIKRSNLSIFQSQSDTIITPSDTIDSNIYLSLPYTSTFDYDCIQQVNSNSPLNGHLTIEHDACMGVTMYPATAYLTDTCKPPCYNCNERLTSGDVHLLMKSLEDRVDDLEESHEHDYKTNTIVLDFNDSTTELVVPIGAILKYIVVDVLTPGTKTVTSTLFTDLALDSILTYKFYSYKYFPNITFTFSAGTGIGKVYLETLTPLV